MSQITRNFGLIVLIIMTATIILVSSSYANPLDSPRKQMLHGILAENVQCQDGFKLILKIEDHTSACVKSSTFNILVSRGWGMMIKETSENITNTSKNIPPVENITKTPQNIPSMSGYHLAFLLNVNSPQFDNNLKVFAKNLRPGDYLLVDANSQLVSEIPDKLSQAKSSVVQGVNVDSVVIYVALNDLETNVSSLPKGIDFIVYDYEGGPGFSPEFTTDMSQSLGLFDQAKSAVLKYNQDTGSNAKFMVTPPYGELKNANWDWGLVAKHMDAMNIQFQSVLKDPTLLKTVVTDAINQKSQESPNTLTLIQLSIVPKKATIQQNIDAINTLQGKGIDAFLIFYSQSDQTSDLEQFFSLLNR